MSDAQKPVLITGSLLRRLKEGLVPPDASWTDEQIDGWWKNYAGSVRNAVDGESRYELQVQGKHPAPCARHCEAQAFNIEIRQLMARKLTHEAIRTAGGIVHADGNIFFTNLDKLNAAIQGATT